MGKIKKYRGDDIVRDKSKGGVRAVPVKGDGVGGKLMQQSGLIDELRSFLEERFLGANQYESIDGAQEIFQQAIDLFSAIHKVDEDGAYDALNKFLGQLIKVMRDSQMTRARVEELDQRLNDLAAEKLRVSTASTIKSASNEFMEAFVDHLRYCYEEFKRLVSRYKEICSVFEDEKRVLERLLQETESEALKKVLAEGEDNLRTALFFASSRQVEFEQKLSLFNSERVIIENKAELTRLWQKLEQTKAWLKPLADSLKILNQRIEAHGKKISALANVEAGEIKKQINFIKTEIEAIRNVFKTVGKEDLFWGCVFGLHEIIDYTPINMLVYRVEVEGRSLLGFSFDEYLSKCSKLKQDLVNYLQLPCDNGFEVETTFVATATADSLSDEEEDNDDEADHSLPATSTDEPIDERGEELIRLCLCVLWGLVADYIEKTSLSEKNLIRGGDFGRMPRKVAKLLLLSGAISRDEKDMVMKRLPGVMEARGLVKISQRKATTKKYKTGEVINKEVSYLILTEAGREKGKELLLQPSGRELAMRAIQENIKLEERYLEKRSVEKEK